MGSRRARSESVYVSEGVLSEILYRLPLKSAFRFTCVSKSWLSLISDPCFPLARARARALLLPQQQQPPCWTLLFHELTDDNRTIVSVPSHHNSFLQNLDASLLDHRLLTLSAVSFPSHIKVQARRLSWYYQIAAVSNGFLLCRLFDQKCCLDQLRYCIINPITWQFIKLPPLSLERSSSLMIGEGFLAQLEGGGTGTVVERYIIVLPDLQSHNNGEIKRHCFTVFSSEIGRWRDFIVDSPEPYGIHWSWRSFALNERIHWYNTSGSSEELMAYDPFNHPNSCHVIKFPSYEISTNRNRMLDASEGRLRCICTTYTNDLLVWILSNFDEGNWTLLHRIDLHDLYAKLAAASINRPRRQLVDFIPLANPNPNLMLFQGASNKLVSYNIETRECKVVDGVEFDVSGGRKYHLFVLPLWPTTIPSP